MEPNLPTGSNVNWALLVSLVCSGLAMIFHLTVPANVQSAMVQLINTVALIAGPLSIIVAFFMHNVLNKPATRAAAMAYGEEVKAAAKRTVPLMLVMLLALVLFTACASLGGGYTATQSELNEVAEAAAIGNDAQTYVMTNCIQAPAPVPGFCANSKTQIKQASTAYLAALTSLDALVKTQSASATAVDADISALTADAAAVQKIEQDSASTKKSIAAVVVIQLVEQLIPVAAELYTQIQSILASGATTSTIDGYLATAQTNDAAIQAW